MGRSDHLVHLFSIVFFLLSSDETGHLLPFVLLHLWSFFVTFYCHFFLLSGFIYVTGKAFVIWCPSFLFIFSVMNLLAEIYSQPEMVPKMLGTAISGERGEFDLNILTQTAEQEERLASSENPYGLAALTPRLWPFMRHSITSVRRSAIRTLVWFFLDSFWSDCAAAVTCICQTYN